MLMKDGQDPSISLVGFPLGESEYLYGTVVFSKRLLQQNKDSQHFLVLQESWHLFEENISETKYYSHHLILLSFSDLLASTVGALSVD